MSDKILKEEERIAFALRSLYKQFGYLPYKMSKFEEYDLYVTNKEFLIGDGVITFTDTDGKLLALKPDVTLSIIKNSADGQNKRKVYYNENVYRISGGTKQFKEIPQAGLELIGEITQYDVFETVYLAACSLAKISSNFVLDISHLGVLFAILQEIKGSENFSRGVMKCFAEKNLHALNALCQEEGVCEKGQEQLRFLLGAYGKPQEVLAKIKPLCEDGKAQKAFEQLEKLCVMLAKTEYAENIRLDFSVVNDMHYYDDVVFKGFVDGIADGVLSGGRYDRLMERMGKKSGGIGFAVNLDLLEGFDKITQTQDVDVLVVYDDKTPAERVAQIVFEQIQKGYSVRAQKKMNGIRYATVLDISGGEV